MLQALLSLPGVVLLAAQMNQTQLFAVVELLEHLLLMVLLRWAAWQVLSKGPQGLRTGQKLGREAACIH